MDVFWQRLDAGIRAATPMISALILVIFEVCKWPIPYLGTIMPPLAFIALFYWSAHRPDLFSPAVSFGIGILNDIVNGLPIGISALLFTVAHLFIWKQRSLFAGHSFLLLWLGFAISAVFLMLAQWALMGIVVWRVVPIFPIAIQTVLAIVLFPLPCWLLIQLQRNIVSST